MGELLASQKVRSKLDRKKWKTGNLKEKDLSLSSEYHSVGSFGEL